MSIPTDSIAVSSAQFLNDSEGNPLYVILPYADFLAMEAAIREEKSDKDYVPHEVACRVLVENCSALRSWREFLGKSTGEIAEKIGISETEYIQWEMLPRLPRRILREKVAAALGIRSEQLKF